jgi:hypothetical protein
MRPTSASARCSRPASRCPTASISTAALIYYVGPVDPVGTKSSGPRARPRPIAWIASPRRCSARRACSRWSARPSADPKPSSHRKYRSAYLIAVGGAAFLVSNAIRASRVVAFPELGMEAVYEFEVRDMPVTVAVSADGVSVHDTGPKAWRGKVRGDRRRRRVADHRCGAAVRHLWTRWRHFGPAPG